MQYTVETSLADFPAWSGAVPVLDALVANGHAEDAEAELEEIAACQDEPLTNTEINDWLWFECQDQHPEWFEEEEEEEEEKNEEGGEEEED